MKDFIAEPWRSILAYNGLSDFESIWMLEAKWFEEPNHRRGGWSGVSRCELNLPNGGSAAIFLKRQENHGTPSWQHPVQGVPTFLREFNRIMNYRSKGIPTLEPVYFGTRRVGKDQRAILITEELSGFVSLEDRVQFWLKEGAPPRREQRSYICLSIGIVSGTGHWVSHAALHVDNDQCSKIGSHVFSLAFKVRRDSVTP